MITPTNLNTTVKNCDGVLLIDKQPGATSFQVVREVKHLFNTPKVGHTGTLDPIATGLLPVCLGRATKLSAMLMEGRKEYDVWARFGIATDSHDRTGTITEEKPWEQLTAAQIQTAIGSFMGKIKQTAPMFSAIKYKGRPLYWYAHRGIMLAERKERDLSIYRFELLEWQPPRARFLIETSQGTYVRTLIHDLARAVDSAAVVDELRRTACGGFRVERALTTETLSLMTPEARQQKLLSLSEALPEYPNVSVNSQLAGRIRAGGTIMWSDLRRDTAEARTELPTTLFKVTGPGGELVAIAGFADDATLSRPSVLYNRVVKTVRIFSE